MTTDIDNINESIEMNLSDSIVLEEAQESSNNETSEDLAKVRYSIQTYDIAGLVRRLNDNELIIPQFGTDTSVLETDGFQREFVWTKQQMDRFIDSILYGYPVPGIFLVEQKNKRLLVLDGQQRLTTLKYFYDGTYPRRGKSAGESRESVFELEYVNNKIKGITYKKLKEEDDLGDLKRQLDNTPIVATIVRAEMPGNKKAIYQIFERINSGGTKLSPHQIRIATYAGGLVEYIQILNSDQAWRDLFGPRSIKVVDHEVISRILALFDNGDKYFKPMKSFIDKFYEKFDDSDISEVKSYGDLFNRASELILEAEGDKFVSKNSISFIDAVYIGVMESLRSGRQLSPDQIREKIETFSKEFDWDSTRYGSDVANVESRIKLAREIFLQD